MELTHVRDSDRGRLGREDEVELGRLHGVDQGVLGHRQLLGLEDLDREGYSHRQRYSK